MGAKRSLEEGTPSKKRPKHNADEGEQGLATLPVARGGGRGLKAVQNAREQTSTASGPDGTVTQSQKKTREQRVFHAHNNKHVETKVMSEQKRKTTRKDGTVIVTESKSLRKVCYM
ncbi:unnamed protein product [Cladocopium goreaui]|uniref:Uncharacterized protein n=1 Tax=Cladocopium goreaui TaxID=2562237 RepID=A0A9P1GLE1_9DINO|nr:unnamed protein product [Cladocopium goreaui]